MGANNIFNRFKDSLGLYCGACQFMELSTRCFHDDYEAALSEPEEFEGLCTCKGISFSNHDIQKVLPYVPLSYIVYVHTCFEDYLNSLYDEIKKFGVGTLYNKEKGESWLKCLCRNIYGKKNPTEIDAMYHICEYYRLVRNNIAHISTSTKDGELESKFKAISQVMIPVDTKVYGELNAPNTLDSISFDDFILFSKSCLMMAKHLYESMRLDYLKLIRAAGDKLLYKWKKYTPDRMEKAVTKYIENRYRCDENFKDAIPSILELIGNYRAVKK